MTYYTIRKLWPRNFFEPGLDVSIYFDLGVRIFSTQPPLGSGETSLNCQKIGAEPDLVAFHI